MIQTKNKLRYMEIYSDIKERIASENYGAGSLLPTEGELTQLYSASRTTIRRAIALLQEDGLVKSVQGKGTEVISPKKWSRPYPFQEFRNFNHITDFRGAPLVEGDHHSGSPRRCGTCGNKDRRGPLRSHRLRSLQDSAYEKLK